MGDRFYVAQINPGQERLAMTELLRVGIKAILLTRKYETAADTVRPWRGSAERQAPLFPGYLFLQMDVNAPDQHWRRACSRRGVQALLGPSQENPTPVPVGIVEELVRRWIEGEFDERKQKEMNRIRVGQRGQFGEKVGECLYSSAKRVELLIGLMRVSVAPEAVVAVG